MGFYRHVDSLTPFVIEGEAYDQKSNLPIENVKVIFVDTGYDSVRSKKAYSILTGQTAADGRIQTRFEYWWGHEEGKGIDPPKKTFEILLFSASHMPKRMLFDESSLKKVDSIVFVELKKVYLVPK